MRPARVGEWVTFLMALAVFIVVLWLMATSEKLPERSNYVTQQELDLLRQESQDQDKRIGLAILNTAYPPEYTDDYYIGSIEQMLGCHACHGTAAKGEE
jgi:hypothetical protein